MAAHFVLLSLLFLFDSQLQDPLRQRGIYVYSFESSVYFQFPIMVPFSLSQLLLPISLYQDLLYVHVLLVYDQDMKVLQSLL